MNGASFASTFLKVRDILVDELFLEIDRVRRNDGFPALSKRVQGRGNQIRERLSHPGPGLDRQRTAPVECRCHFGGHLLLFGSVFKVLRSGEEAAVRKCLMHARRQRRSRSWRIRGSSGSLLWDAAVLGCGHPAYAREVKITERIDGAHLDHEKLIPCAENILH